jgi:hypothetical protein
MEQHYNKLTQKQIALENQNSINDLTKDVEILKRDLKETSDDVKRILFFFNSDSNTKSEGFIERSNRHDTEIKYLLSKYKELIVAAGVVSFMVSGIILIVKWVLER